MTKSRFSIEQQGKIIDAIETLKLTVFAQIVIEQVLKDNNMVSYNGKSSFQLADEIESEFWDGNEFELPKKSEIPGFGDWFYCVVQNLMSLNQ